jgi:hypothetical protein
MTLDYESMGDVLDRLSAENTRLQNLLNALLNRLNNPEVNLFLEGIKIEAAHQVERWGEDHDANKTFEQWTALLVRLLGKFVDSNWNKDHTKSLHHLITMAAVCANAHRQMVEKEAVYRNRPGDEESGT